MIIAALGFSANAQRGVQVNNGNYSSIRQYIHVLNLSPSQVRDWSDLNRYYEDEFFYVRNDRRLSNRERTRKLEKLYDKRDRDLRGILTNRQYRKFSGLRSFHSYNRPTTVIYNSGARYNNGRYNNGRYNNGRRYGNSCPANGRRYYRY